ncbi:MAG: chorismate pyruvate-lyase family protein [Methanosarcinaceae archaeon]|nr:chorismate pyruvate-lyase family protein [Methanosarcinaceae archaeon]
MKPNFLKKLNCLEIPTCLRVCCGNDGSVTFLLELMTRSPVKVLTEAQCIRRASRQEAVLLEIEEGSKLNFRKVRLYAGDTLFAQAKSLSPLERMPPSMQEELMRAEIPIGKILREHALETRRDMGELKVLKEKTSFGSTPVLSRTYKIIHKNNVLMWIKEEFPIDERWEL